LSKVTCCILSCPVIAADVLMTARHSAINPRQRVCRDILWVVAFGRADGELGDT
jgi:hypothetical protein